MIALIIIFVILFLVLICPVGAAVRYSSEGISLKIVAGIIKIGILPKKKKNVEDAKKEKKKKKRKTKHKKQENPDQEKKTEKNVKEESKEKLGGKLDFFRQLLGIGLDALGCLRRKLILRNLILYLTVGGKPDDAAGSAILYGRAWAAIGALTPVLENSFRIHNRDLQAFLDYSQADTTVYAEGTIVIRIGDILWIAIFYGLKVLKIFLQRKRNKKKGGSKNGSSD